MPRIVVVEDEVELRDLIVDELMDLNNEVFVAENGVEGLAAIDEHRPDIVLCDVDMPVMNGFQMRQEMVSRQGGENGPKFIYLSAQTSEEDIANGLMLGADHYVTKPIDFDRLAVLIRDRAE